MVSAEFNLSEGYLSAIFKKGDRHQLCRVSGAAPRQGGLCSAAGWLQGFGSAGAAGVQQHPVFPPCVQARDGGQPQRIPRVTHPWRAVGRPIPPGRREQHAAGTYPDRRGRRPLQCRMHSGSNSKAKDIASNNFAKGTILLHKNRSLFFGEQLHRTGLLPLMRRILVWYDADTASGTDKPAAEQSTP